MGQVRNRWSTDFELSLHRQHQKVPCCPLLIRLSPMGILCFRIDHMSSLVLRGGFELPHTFPPYINLLQFMNVCKA